MAKKGASLEFRANKLRKTLLSNLAARGLVEPIYDDMVDDYIELWIQRAKLDADILERGVTVYDGKRDMMVDNICVSRRVQVSHQMLAIYRDLGFRDQAVKARAPDGEDDEL